MFDGIAARGMLPIMEQKPYYSVTEAASIIGLSGRRIRQLIAGGTIEALTTAGGHKLVPHSRIARFVKARNRKAKR